MYTPESILFPYNTLIFAQFRVKNKPCSTTKNEQSAPGGGLYGLMDKAQGSAGIFIRSIKQEFGITH
ncbi:hypothetical protein DXF93_09135 [Escherichia coli]|nr:hypothetical protein C2U51_21910 [Enterobacteriaceae bacterium ENNIH1]RDT55140.1 hypothetical protein DXF93_09135 [Escherichia coli]